MGRRGLSKEIIVEEAVSMIEASGLGSFSMRELAERLGVRTASLYNHVQSIRALCGEVGVSASRRMGEALGRALAGRDRDGAVQAAAAAYRRFEKEHPALYQAIQYLPQAGGTYVEASSAFLLPPIMEMLSAYRISAEDRLHAQRIFRAVMHGFLTQERAGFFSHPAPDCEESCRMAIAALTEQLKRMEAAACERG